MTKGSTARHIIAFTLPLLVGNIFQQMYNMVDTFVVGRYIGKDALAAVGTSFTVTLLINTLIMGLCAGMSILVSQSFGAKEYQKLKRAVSTAIIVTAAGSALFTAAGLMLAKPLLSLLGTPAELFQSASAYLSILFWGTLFVFSYNAFAAMLRSIGDSKTPLYFLIISSVINIVLDLFFVLKLNMGVAGVAYATVISQAVSSISCAAYTFKKVPMFRIKLSEMVFDRRVFSTMFKFGSASMIQNSAFSLGMMLIQGLVNSYGANVMAAYATAAKIESFVQMPLQNIGMAVSTYTAQNTGAGNLERVKKGIVSAIKIVAVFTLAMTALMLTFSKYLILIFIDKAETEVVSIGVEYLNLVAVFYIFLGFIHIFVNFLRGTGYVLFPMINTISELSFRVIIAYSFAFFMGYHGIFWGRPLSFMLSAGCLIYAYRKGGWQQKVLANRKFEE